MFARKRENSVTDGMFDQRRGGGEGIKLYVASKRNLARRTYVRTRTNTAPRRDSDDGGGGGSRQ